MENSFQQSLLKVCTILNKPPLVLVCDEDLPEKRLKRDNGKF